MNIDINPTLYGTLALLEALWLVINAVGVGYTWGNKRNARDVYRAALTPPSERAEVKIASMDLFIHKMLLAAQLGFIMPGVLGAFVPPPIRPSTATAISWSMIILMFVGPVLLMALSAGVARMRRELDYLLRSQQHRNGNGGR